MKLGIVKERSSKWARMSDDRSRRARTLDRPHRMNPDAWSNYRGTTHSVVKLCIDDTMINSSTCFQGWGGPA